MDIMAAKVVKLEDVLKQNQNKNKDKKEEPESMTSSNRKKSKPKMPIEETPRGRPKSGRTWKTVKKRFSSIIKTKGIRDSFAKKQALREEMKRVKEVSRAAVAARQEETLQKKQRRRENLKRQEENRKKSEIVQVIKNPSKIKRMKKKQLRSIEKRDTN